MPLLLRYLKQYKKYLFLALALATVNQFFSLLDPQILRLLIDRYATHAGSLASNEFVRGVLLLLVGLVGVAFVSRVAKSFQDYYVNVVTQRVGTSLYNHAVAHSFSLPYMVFEDQRSGEVLLKLQKAKLDSQALIISSINTLFLSIVTISFVLAYAFAVHWLVGTVYFLIIPVIGGSTYLISRRIKLIQRAIVAESADLAGSMTETLRNVELVKSLGLEGQETKRLNTVNEKILALELKKVKLVRVLSFIQGTLLNAMRSTILFVMLWLIFKGSITVGQFFSLFIYSFFVFMPLAEFGTVASQYQEAKGSMEALEKILAIPPEGKPKDTVPIDGLDSVAFKNVSFAYGGSGGDVIRRVSLRIGKGETIAFAGPSGSGKSTLVKLLVGLYKPRSGEIEINTTDARRVDYQKLRSKIGYVSQETQLFAGTFRENLLFVHPHATDEECVAALKAASALPIIERGGKGLDTKIGEGGIKISGGERQRLAIARALLRNPELIIFDEATSSLDSITEREITNTIRGIAKERPNLMMVLVAHRLSTLMHANHIYVLERGTVAEEGSHKNLLAARGLYEALWREQSAGNNHESR